MAKKKELVNEWIPVALAETKKGNERIYTN